MLNRNHIGMFIVFLLLIAFNLQVALSAEDDYCDAYNSPPKIYMIPVAELTKLTIPELENATTIVRKRYLESKAYYDAGSSELVFVLDAEANLKQMQQALETKKQMQIPIKTPEVIPAICDSVPLYLQPNIAFSQFKLSELENIQNLLENKVKDYKGRYQSGGMPMLPLTIAEANCNKITRLINARNNNNKTVAECPAPVSNVPLFLQPATTLAQMSMDDLRDIRRVLSIQVEDAKSSSRGGKAGVWALIAINADLAQIEAALALKQKAESLSKEQAEKLADRIIENTATQNRHRTSDSEWVATEFEWIVFENIKDNPDILNATVLEKIKKKYQIFNSRDDIPEKFRGYGENKKIGGYNGGFIYKYNITFDSADTITINFEMYFAHLNATGWENKYKWDGKEWIIISHMEKRWKS